MGHPVPQAFLSDPTGVVHNVWRPRYNSPCYLYNEGNALIRRLFLLNNDKITKILLLKCRQNLVSPLFVLRLDTSILNCFLGMSK